jgi:predicted RNA binding protein YcfA (HicA-like mRNA interferase family)
MPSEVRFAVLRRLLERGGWKLVRVSGSHHVFKKAGAPDVVLPVHGGKVKPYYARQVEKLVQGD